MKITCALTALLLVLIAFVISRPRRVPESGAKAPRTLASYDDQVSELMSRMTLEEKVGQMTQAEQDGLKDIADIDKYHLGSLFCGGNSDPKDGNSLQAWTDMYDHFQSQTSKTRLGIPVLFGVDAVHGHNNVLNAVIFPHNIGMGCTRDAKLVEQESRITAEELKATGFNWAFGPCVAVPRDERWGRSTRGMVRHRNWPERSAKLPSGGFRGMISPAP